MYTILTYERKVLFTSQHTQYRSLLHVSTKTRTGLCRQVKVVSSMKMMRLLHMYTIFTDERKVLFTSQHTQYRSLLHVSTKTRTGLCRQVKVVSSMKMMRLLHMYTILTYERKVLFTSQHTQYRSLLHVSTKTRIIFWKKNALEFIWLINVKLSTIN